MSKKRIHDLAKEFGLPGKDLAARLRDFGFSKAKSHMSALDEFEELQARGLLEANGIEPSAKTEAPAPDADTSGGLKVVRKKKKKVAPAEPEEVYHEGPFPSSDAAPAPETTSDEPISAESVPAEAATGQASPAAPATEADGAQEEDLAPETVEPAPSATDSVAPPASNEAASAKTPAETGSGPDSPVAVPTTETHGSSSTSDPAPAATPAAAESTEAPAAAQDAGQAPGAAEPQDGATAEPAGPTAAAVAAAESASTAGGPEIVPHTKTAKAGPKPKGKILGRIDPSTLQAQRPEKRRESRRLLSRDDVAPDVRPTFGKGGKEGQRGARGNLTAAQLREREQGRFLRRNRQGGVQGQRRSGGRPGPRTQITDSPLSGQTVAIVAPVTVAKLSETLKLKSAVIQKMAMQKQYGMFTLNSILDEDTAVLLASEYEVELDVRAEATAESHIEEVRKQRSQIEEEHLEVRAPIVAFLGHVDHGKTTLIDKLRATKIADGESGGITQHIGAYKVSSKAGNTITILDTPGHQAFTAMRARGAQAVDVVVLVVAGDDGVKPSTEEAIAHAKAAETPIIVAVNKKDKPSFNFNQAVQQLMGHELIPEQYGGTTAMFETSGITGEGLDELIDHIFLMGEAELELNAHPEGPASGVVLEAEIQQGRGIVAHILVKDGTLKRGEVILAGEGYGKVKQMMDDQGKIVQEAGPSSPVSVTGLDALPGVGDPFYVIDALSKAKEVAVERERNNRAMAMAASRTQNPDLAAILGSAPLQARETINLIVRCDVQGSVEVIKHEVAKLEHDEVEVKIVFAGVGAITESDIDLASTSDATLVAFHMGIPGKIRQEAERRKLTVRRYDVIYELLDDLRDLMEGSLSPELVEEIQGHTEIKALFKSSKIGLIAGCEVRDGKLSRNHKIRLLRDDAVIYTGELQSLRREKDDVRDVREGFECGIVLRDYRDLQVGDILESYSVKEIKRTLA